MADGFVLMDKPRGMRSREAVDRVKVMFRASQAGHSGTLDTNATGLLLVAVGEARKAMPLLIGLEKEYIGTIHLHSSTKGDAIRAAIKQFEGEISQLPPKRSAVRRKPRKRRVHSIKIEGISGKDIRFRIRCEAGVYVRRLASDLGERLGVGAHLADLRRTGIGGFKIKEAVTLENLGKNPRDSLIPIEKVLERTGLKRIFIKEEAVEKVRNGAPLLGKWVERTDAVEKGQYVGFYFGGKIVALGTCKTDGRDMGRVLARTERVFSL